MFYKHMYCCLFVYIYTFERIWKATQKYCCNYCRKFKFRKIHFVNSCCYAPAAPRQWGAAAPSAPATFMYSRARRKRLYCGGKEKRGQTFCPITLKRTDQVSCCWAGSPSFILWGFQGEACRSFLLSSPKRGWKHVWLELGKMDVHWKERGRVHLSFISLSDWAEQQIQTQRGLTSGTA